MHRVIPSKLSPLALAFRASMLAMFLSGCSESFAASLRNHSYCVERAGIMQFKVDDCLERTHGDRERMDECLTDQDVPRIRIARLDECVEAARNKSY